MTARTVLIALILLPLAGCVSKSAYHALQQEHEDTRASLLAQLEHEAEVRDARIGELEGELDACEEEGRRLTGRVETLEGDNRRLNRSLEEAQSRIATLVGDRSRIQQSVTELQNVLAEVDRRKREADRRVEQYRMLLSRFRSLIDAGQLQVKIEDGRMVVELAADVLFPSGSAQLSESGRQTIEEVGSVLQTIPERRFQVEGHTDSVPIRTERFPSNWYLGAGRALTVVESLLRAGMPQERISAASFGETRPTATNDTPEGRASNRRIEIVVVPDLHDLPGYDELQAAFQAGG